MSLDKAIEHGKEKRKPYRGSKVIDRSCRNHGNCGWCEVLGYILVDVKRKLVDSVLRRWRNKL